MDKYMKKSDVIAYIRKKAKEAQSAFDELGGESGIIAEAFEDLANELEAFPTADVAPVVHSRWAHIGGDEWCCPVCGFVITTEGSWDKPTKKYCEDYGTKMDGAE